MPGRRYNINLLRLRFGHDDSIARNQQSESGQVVDPQRRQLDPSQDQLQNEADDGKGQHRVQAAVVVGWRCIESSHTLRLRVCPLSQPIL